MQNQKTEVLLYYLAFKESWVALVNPSKARFKKHSPYPRGAFGCASLLIVFELVCNAQINKHEQNNIQRP
jgi:hypothetical protein